MRVLSFAVVACCLLVACARTQAESGTPRSNNALLSAQQIISTNSSNVYDAIAKLRPDWLLSRGPNSVTDPTPAVASVYMNGTMLGKIDYLRQVGPLDVTEVRYWDAGRASARFGMGHPRGVIEIIRQ